MARCEFSTRPRLAEMPRAAKKRPAAASAAPARPAKHPAGEASDTQSDSSCCFFNSAWASLDSHGTIQLVLDQIEEQDAFCTSLVCRPFRDALQRRFPFRLITVQGTKSRWSTGNMKTKPGRFLTAAAGVLSPSRLPWARQLLGVPDWLLNGDRRLHVHAAKLGRLPVLQFLKATGIPFDNRDISICAAAAEGGDIETLRWTLEETHPDALTRESFWTVNNLRLLSLGAVTSGQMCIVQHLIEADLFEDGSRELMPAAARGGSLDIVQLLHRRGITISAASDVQVCINAAEMGHLDILEYVRKNGAPWISNVFLYIAAAGHFEVLKWVHANGFAQEELRPQLWGAAAQGGNLDIMRWWKTKGCGWGRVVNDEAPQSMDMYRAAAERGDVEMMQWAFDQGAPLITAATHDSARLFEAATESGHLAADGPGPQGVGPWRCYTC
eukprot:COSAG02_NODE_10751_length_1866_cov_0.825127_1_plen_440_part_01